MRNVTARTGAGPAGETAANREPGMMATAIIRAGRIRAVVGVGMGIVVRLSAAPAPASARGPGTSDATAGKAPALGAAPVGIPVQDRLRDLGLTTAAMPRSRPIRMRSTQPLEARAPELGRAPAMAPDQVMAQPLPATSRPPAGPGALDPAARRPVATTAARDRAAPAGAQARASARARTRALAPARAPDGLLPPRDLFGRRGSSPWQEHTRRRAGRDGARRY